jgi:hypothetical protein
MKIEVSPIPLPPALPPSQFFLEASVYPPVTLRPSPAPLCRVFCNIRDNLTTNFLVNTAKTERDAKGF